MKVDPVDDYCRPYYDALVDQKKKIAHRCEISRSKQKRVFDIKILYFYHNIYDWILIYKVYLL